MVVRMGFSDSAQMVAQTCRLSLLQRAEGGADAHGGADAMHVLSERVVRTCCRLLLRAHTMVRRIACRRCSAQMVVQTCGLHSAQQWRRHVACRCGGTPTMVRTCWWHRLTTRTSRRSQQLDSKVSGGLGEARNWRTLGL